MGFSFSLLHQKSEPNNKSISARNYQKKLNQINYTFLFGLLERNEQSIEKRFVAGYTG